MRKNRIFKSMASVALTLAMAFTTITPAFAASGAIEPSTTEYTKPGNYTYKVTSDGWYEIEAAGGSGGSYHSSGTGIYTEGGYGGYVKSKIYLKSGETLSILVGSSGTNGLVGGNAVTSGGVKTEYGYGGSTTQLHFASGGGLSLIRSGSTDLVIAGGGGGSSMYTNGLAGGVASSGNNGTYLYGSNGVGSYAGGGAGYRGGTPGSTSSQSHGGSNYALTSYNGNSVTVEANKGGYNYGAGKVVIEKCSNYSLTVDLNGGNINGAEKLSYSYTNKSYTWNFGYTGSTQAWTAPSDGFYQLNVVGASGGGNTSGGSRGGAGGRSTGTIYLKKGTTLYVNVGGKGYEAQNATGGWNGGGNKYSNFNGGNSGGGATDISLYWNGASTAWNNYNHLYSRIIVAGGGGGADNSELGSAGTADDGSGGVGGGINGGYGTMDGSVTGLWAPGTQNSGNAFGYGGSVASYNVDAGAGGGGWYGGVESGRGYQYGAGGAPNLHQSGGAGGSGYIYSAAYAGYYPSGCLLNSSYYLSSASTYAGVNYGNGYASISQLSDCQILPIPSREGYTFTGYSLVGGVGSLTNNSSYWIYNYAVGEGRVVANWKQNAQYGNLTINPNGGFYDDKSENTLVTKVSGTVYTVKTPYRYGYIFMGWTLDSGSQLTGNTYTFSTASNTITANWKKAETTVTINPNGGSYEGSTDVTTLGGSYGDVKKISTPTRENYTFVSWKETLGSDGWYDENGWHFGTTNGNLEAVWVISKGVEVGRYDLNSGDAGTSRYVTMLDSEGNENSTVYAKAGNGGYIDRTDAEIDFNHSCEYLKGIMNGKSVDYSVIPSADDATYGGLYKAAKASGSNIIDSLHSETPDIVFGSITLVETLQDSDVSTKHGNGSTTIEYVNAIKFDGNGAEVIKDYDTFIDIDRTDYTLEAVADHYANGTKQFMYWSDKADGSGVHIKDMATLSFEEIRDLNTKQIPTLYAIWGDSVTIFNTND